MTTTRSRFGSMASLGTLALACAAAMVATAAEAQTGRGANAIMPWAYTLNIT